MVAKNPQASKVSDKNYFMIEISKRDLYTYLTPRYRGLSFLKKIVSLIFPSNFPENKKMRYIDLF